MNIPDVVIHCPECKDGVMIHDRFDFKTGGVATPIVSLSGTTNYAISMKYQCKKCQCTSKANNGALYHQFPFQYRKSYPVDAAWAGSNTMHYDETTTRIIENLMPTNGNGNQISRMVHQMRAMKFEDFEESYFTQAKETKTKITEPPPPFQEWISSHGWTGQQVRTQYTKAAKSKLNSTGVSRNMNNNRQIQSVGCRVASSSDCTFATIKNYISVNIFGAKAVHTIGKY